MNRPLKTANVTEALEAFANDSFVYNNPCSTCNKQCSTPTKEIWLRRIREFHGIEQMYQQYKCRNCRKLEPCNVKAQDPVHHIASEPLVKAVKPIIQMMAKNKPATETQHEPIAPQRQRPKPGDAVKAPPNSIGVSVWETSINGDMEYRGTQWTKISDK